MCYVNFALLEMLHFLLFKMKLEYVYNNTDVFLYYICNTAKINNYTAVSEQRRYKWKIESH